MSIVKLKSKTLSQHKIKFSNPHRSGFVDIQIMILIERENFMSCHTVFHRLATKTKRKKKKLRVNKYLLSK